MELKLSVMDMMRTMIDTFNRTIMELKSTNMFRFLALLAPF